ncbi:hypothetical protein M0802_007598 [Mischocyttarus mexicanus]|nr:hypothetical protein M0802_007598 [Mischocyttarus mexicanus]
MQSGQQSTSAFRVSGLRSVGRLFPNLTLIRGHSLFINYALVAFEMMHLQEIGLHSLTDILRGSVRFEKNPALCYVDTIDWDIIGKAGKGEHVISGNKPKNDCPKCEKHCTARLTNNKPDETYCWNRQHCQRICDKCIESSCNVSGQCCHPSCLGDCTGPTANDCKVCKNVLLGVNQCEERCPDGTYEFMNRRCIGEDECRKMMKPREALSIVKDYPYKPFNGSCIIECPAGYMDEEVNNKTSCRKCKGPCLKECRGTSVDSIASAQKLRGCTHITGSLEIQIRGGKNIVNELEDSLNMIEEIDGYLKIVRSFPLISLNFLKSLRVIRGNFLDNNKYTLAVLDNQNLQELWDWSTHGNIGIYSKDGPAKVFFHFNPKLCFYKIEALRKKAHLQEFSDLEVAPNSNGDKVACNVTELKTVVTKTTSDAALIEWEQFTHHDPRSLLGYVVYFIEAPNENVTMYDGRDACGGDGWRVDDVSAIEGTTKSVTPNYTEPEKTTYLSHILTQLKPYTQYAFYVKTYTIATERSGAQSKVTYFTTKPHAPSAPRALTTRSNSSSEIIISWSPPLKKNGNLTHYRIMGRWVKDDSSFIDQRNYCDEPMPLPEKKSIPTIAEEERKRAEEELVKVPDLATCDCADRELDQSMREKEVSSSIAFEDALHNQVYVKRIDARRRRDTTELLQVIKFIDQSITQAEALQKKYPYEEMINNTYITFDREVPTPNLSYVLKNLRHFAYYNIEVQACREVVKNDTNDTCSTKSMKTYRTLPLKDADNIPPKTVKMFKMKTNNSFTDIKLTWAEPTEPNGLIVTYQIEYKRVDIKNVMIFYFRIALTSNQNMQSCKFDYFTYLQIKATVVCITRRDFNASGNTYYLKDLPPGNYSIKVRATSLAGNGNYTQPLYFFIKESSIGLHWILFWSIFCILLLVLLPPVFYFCKRKYMRNVPSIRLIATVNPEYVSTVYVPDEWEVPRKKIQVLKELGNGSFGMVYEGLAKDVVKGKPEVPCAVKTVNENATDRERIEFLNEAAFNTHHVVRLLGVVSQGQPTLVVMELMVNGDLKTYLRSHRPDVCENFSRQPPTLQRILQMAIEIADGMAYLAAKKFVHRDLAARNCMVAEDLTVKIGDFGMTRDIYETDYYRKGTKGLLPVRWMAPESLKDGVFTSFSDVWSYGVVLWEMVTLASQPYQGLSNDQVLRYVIEGGVMERPENCPDSLYNLMRRTWCHKATRRPTFIDIATVLLPDTTNLEDFERVSFYHSSEGIEARNQNMSHSPQTDKDLEMATLQECREEEAEGEEDSPLRQDFGDFASFEPTSIKNSLSPRYTLEPYGENSKTTTNFHDMNLSKIPLKAGFDDFDGISGDSLASSKDTLNLPFVEDSLKSVKNSPFVHAKSTSKGIDNQTSTGRATSLQNLIKQHIQQQRTQEDSPISINSKSKKHPDYENSSPMILASYERNFSFPSLSLNTLEIDVDIEGKDRRHSPRVEYMNEPETLNNGYIGGNNKKT